jgi:hypothetical protein
MCSDLPQKTLASVDEAIAALTAPFPNAWQLCAGSMFYRGCPQSAPYVSFDAGGTHMSCGNLYEGGFVAVDTIPLYITQDTWGNILLTWPLPDGARTMFLQFHTDASGARLLWLSEHGDPPPPPTMMVPAPPLP